MQLLKLFVMMVALLPSLSNANNCAILVKLESPYLQNKTIYLDEILSQPVVNNQLCLTNTDVGNNTEPYYLEFFLGDSSNLDSVMIFPEYYMQRDIISITTADLLTSFCRQCNEVKQYRQFINSSQVKKVAAEIDVFAASRPDAIMLDIIKQQFQQTLLNIYNQGVDKAELSRLAAEPQKHASDEVDKYRVSDSPDSDIKALRHSLPVYGGAELQHSIPKGLQLNRVDSLPLVSYRVDATTTAVVDFYQFYFPDYERIGFDNFIVLTQERLPFDGYNAKYMSIPHIVISEDPLGKGKTLLQITYRPDADGIKGTRAMVFKPVT